MSESIQLLGSEDVRQAGYNMASAAESMRQTSGYMHETLERFTQRVEAALIEHAERIEAAVEKQGER